MAEGKETRSSENPNYSVKGCYYNLSNAAIARACMCPNATFSNLHCLFSDTAFIPIIAKLVFP